MELTLILKIKNKNCQKKNRVNVGIQKASTMSSIISAFAAGIVRKIEHVNSKIVISLQVDKSRCTDVRHYNFKKQEKNSTKHRLYIA